MSTLESSSSRRTRPALEATPFNKTFFSIVLALTLVAGAISLVTPIATPILPAVEVEAAITSPTQIPGGNLQLWLDASDPNGDGTLPADGAAVTTWQDKSGNNNDATAQVGPDLSGATFQNGPTDTIGGQPVLDFNRLTQNTGSAYDVNIDLRAGTTEDITVFTVYRPSSIPNNFQDWTALWGLDDGEWDRFFLSSYEPVLPTIGNDGGDDGIVGLGPDDEGALVVDAGVVDQVRLLTTVYDGAVDGAGTTGNNGPVNGSAVYFDGDLVTSFTDTTHPTDAQDTFSIGEDGKTQGFYDGAIAEMIVYDKKLSDAEIADVNCYLNEKYAQSFGAGPGGVNCGVEVWLDASQGITQSGGTVSQWASQSSDVVYGQTTGTQQPAYLDSEINFNPVVNFTRGDDELFNTPGVASIDQVVYVVAGFNENSGQNNVALSGVQGGQVDDLLLTENASNVLGSWDGNKDLSASAYTENVPGIIRVDNDGGTTQTFGLNGTDSAAVASSVDAQMTHLGNVANGVDQPFGKMAEVIVYDKTNETATERQQIESYLALKYGVTLEAGVGSYLSGTGTSVYDLTAPYNNNVVGLARDASSTLDQRVSTSTNPGDILTLATDNDFVSPNATGRTQLADQSYYVLGHNGASATTVDTTELDTTVYTGRIPRQWRVQNTNTTGSISYQFDGFGGNWVLLADADGDFSTGATVVANTATGSNFLASDGSITAPALPTGTYLTLAYDPIVVSVSDVTVTEGDTGTVDADVTLTLNRAPGVGGATVLYDFNDGTALAGEDYTDPSATDATANRVVFAPAETTKTITVAVTGDNLEELDEAFTLDAYLDIARDSGFDNGTVAYTPLSGTTTCSTASLNGPHIFETGQQTTYDGGSGSTNQILEVDCQSQGLQSGLNTIVGNEYNVSFDASRRTGPGAPTPSSVSVTVEAVDENTGTVIDSATVTRDNTTFEFVKTEFSFTATSPTTTLRFTTTNPQGAGMIFDNLSINPVSPSDTGTVTITNDDTAAVTVDPGAAISITEDTDTGAFNVSLETQPTDDVTITVTSSDTGAATVSASTLVFTSANWDTDQPVTITPVSDADVRDETVTITFAVDTANSDDTYDAITDLTRTVTIADDDTATIVVNPDSIVVAEDAGTNTFTVVLGAQPTDDVIIDLTSSATGEATVAPGFLTFTSADWDTPQTVTVTGVNDDQDTVTDSEATISVAVRDTSDAAFDTLSEDVEVTLTDDDTAGFTVTPATSVNILEELSQGTFDVALTAEPASSVTINITSDDTGAATVTPASVTFDATNWDTAQEVTAISAADDDILDESVTFTFAIDDATSDDRFDTLADQTRTVTVDDNDTAGLSVSPDTGIREEGGLDFLEVALTSQPQSDVVVTVVSADPAAVRVDSSSATLTFTPANWSTTQNAVVSAPSDADTNDESVAVTFAVDTANSDPAYTAPSIVRTVTVTDNDVPGLEVDNTTGIAISEDIDTGTFKVALKNQPLTNVVVDVTSSDTGAATVNPATLTFTPTTWDDEQDVTVTPVSDTDTRDETVTITFATNDASSDDDFDGLTEDRTVTITDDDNAGVLVTDNLLALTEGGATDTVDFRLTTQPTADVTLTLPANEQLDYGDGFDTASTLTFTDTTWNTAQTITFTALDDLVVEGTQTFDITATLTSTDTEYDGLTSPDLTVTTTDNDTASVVINPDSITVDENAGTEDFTVVLGAAPQTNVVIDLTSGSTADATISPATMTFTPTNWNTPQTATVTGVNDETLGDDTATITVAVNEAASDDLFDSLSETVTVTLTNDDTASLVLSQTALSINEAGGNGTFTIALGAQPASDVVIDVTSSAPGEVTAAPATVTFTSTDWDQPQTITATGVNDNNQSADTGTITATVNTGLSDASFAGFSEDVAITLIDDDTAGITVTPVDTVTDEDGDTGTATVVLNTQPASNVTIDLTSSDPTEGTVSPAQLIFTPTNWATPQTLTVTGVNEGDSISDGNITYTIETAPAISGDANYSGFDAADITMENQNTDAPGITAASSATTTGEDGTSVTLTYTLLSDPVDEVVTIPVSLSDDTEATLDIDSVVLDTTNWNTGVAVTVTGANDPEIDGEIVYTVVSGDSVSNGLGNNEYGGLAVVDFTLTNLDNDVDDDNDGVSNEQETQDGTDPTNPNDPKDDDGDGVPNAVEREQGTDPSDPSDFLDTDNGGTPDYVETTVMINNGLPASNVNDPSDDFRDTDKDGVPDVVELKENTDPTDSTDAKDDDGDGVPNYVEREQGTDPSNPNDPQDDDGDGVPNYIENQQGTDPADPSDFLDTDGGGKSDYQETREGTDINDAGDDLDADGDGVSDIDEQATANSGDANADGTPDYLQGGVVTVANAVTSAPVTLEATGVCNFVNAFEIVTEASLATQDDTAEYILGLHDFTLTCATPGASADVTVIWDQVYDTSKWTYKKYENSSYTNIDSFVSYATRTVSRVDKTTSSYTVTDGSDLDLDGAVNNSITDPAGPSIPVVTTDTGDQGTGDNATPGSNGPDKLLRTGGEALKQYSAPFLLIGTGLLALATTVLSKLRRRD